MNWIAFLFSFEGRISRSDYWLRFVTPFTIIFVAAVVAVDPLDFHKVMLPLTLAGLCLWVAPAVKRCHDRDRSGWFLLIFLVPWVGQLWLLIELGFLRGTVGPNRFGPDPLAGVRELRSAP